MPTKPDCNPIAQQMLRDMGVKMTELRLSLGLTADDFGDALMLSRAVITNREMGRSLWKPAEIIAAPTMLEQWLTRRIGKHRTALDGAALLMGQAELIHRISRQKA